MIQQHSAKYYKQHINLKYVYIHRRNDTNAIFYIGKGSGYRAWCMKRTEYWRRVAMKHGYSVEIVAEFDTDAEAFALETQMIADARAGGEPLVNICDGGEGASGNTKYPLEMMQAVCDEYAAGASSKKLAKKYKVDAQSIILWLRKFGYDVRKSTAYQRTGGRNANSTLRVQMTSDVEVKMCDEYKNTDISIYLLAKKYNISNAICRRIITNNNIELKHLQPFKLQEAVAADYVEHCMTVNQLMEKYQFSSMQIYAMLKRTKTKMRGFGQTLKRRVTIDDGVTVYESLADLIRACGKGKTGSRSQNLKYLD